MSPPRLNKKLLLSAAYQDRDDLCVPPARVDLPEKVVQFGTGGFLRAFANYFIDQANRRGLFNGRVVMVQSTGSRRAETLAEQDGLYTLWVRGLEEDRPEAAGVLVIDDYAHHPTEVVATLQAVSDGFADRRIVAVFQPHLYSRTTDFLEDFARSFFNADMLVVMDVFGAREDLVEGVDGRLVADIADAETDALVSGLEV